MRREAMRADALRRRVVSAGAPGRERVRPDALLRKAMLRCAVGGERWAGSE